jgi:hypothetical protein
MLARFAFYGALAAMVVAEIVEPPIALVVAAGHALASSKSKVAEALAEAASDV